LEKQTAQEELKARIYELYSKFKDEPSSDRRQVYYGQICELVYKWCGEHLFYKETEEMGKEIVEAVKRFIEGKKISKEYFYPDLYTALVNARNQYHRDKVEGSLRVPRIIKQIKKIIEREESNEERQLTLDEKVTRLKRMLPLSEKTIREYLESTARKFFSIASDDDNNDITESVSGHSLTMEGTVFDPQGQTMKDSEMDTIRDALEGVLNKTQKRTKPFIKALFTARCLELFKNYQILLPLLDSEILEMAKTSGKIPTQYEIYMKHHPAAKKTTAETNASQMSKKFFADLDREIEEKIRRY